MQHGPGCSPCFKSIRQMPGRHAEIDQTSLRLCETQIVFPGDCAASKRNDNPFGVRYRAQVLGFKASECFFSLIGKDSLHRAARRPLDISIQIDKVISKPICEAGSEGALAAPHKTRQIDARRNGHRGYSGNISRSECKW